MRIPWLTGAMLVAATTTLPSVAVNAAIPRGMMRADVRDLGRALPAAPVSIALTLAYGHAAELEALVRLQSDRRSPLYHRYLSNRQFDAYFGPSPAAYLAASRALERAGFRIAHTFSNRTVIDAVGPASGAERYFGAEIHRVRQLGVGIRYANVRPAVIPAELRGTVTTVAGLSNVNVVKPLFRFPSAAGRAAQRARAQRLALMTDQRPLGRPAESVHLQPPAVALNESQVVGLNAVANPGFESGGRYWKQCGHVNASIVRTRVHSGRYSGFMGTLSGAEIKGDAGLCQAVTVPAHGVVSFWLYQGSNEPNTHYAWQWAGFVDARGRIVARLYASVNTIGWRHLAYNVSALAGRRLYLYFGVHADGHAGHHTYQYVDDISLTGVTSVAAPAPTQAPRPQPTAAPATTTPIWLPTSAPAPSSQPTGIAPLPLPISIPTQGAGASTGTGSGSGGGSGTGGGSGSGSGSGSESGSGSGGSGSGSGPTPGPSTGPGAPIAGPINGPDGGYSPLATAQGYDLPVQHGYDGSGRSAGIAVWGDVLGSDLTAYEQQWGIVPSGQTYRVAIDGGAAFDANAYDENNGSIEAELDAETIAGNAPGANIYLYEFPTGSDQDIEDAYNQAVSDNVVDVMSSSFGGCESDDPAFSQATNQIALQGAAKGITFAASAGDWGSLACGLNYDQPGVSAPSGNPIFVSVGGTSLTVNGGGTWTSETVWNSEGDATGGGVSTLFPTPAYQQGLAGTIASGRNQPDIALSADPDNGTSIYFDGEWIGPFGGTSWSSPIFSAYLTELAEMHGTRAGFVNPSLYAAFGQAGYLFYRDITLGNNFGYAAHIGYDQASGLGSFSSAYGLASALP